MQDFYRFAGDNPWLIFGLGLLLLYLFACLSNMLVTLVRGRKPESFCQNCDCQGCAKKRSDKDASN